MKPFSLSFSGLSKQLGNRQLLQDESLSLQAGQMHMIGGSNGAGKTTLLRIVAGLEKPDCATVTVNATTSSWRKQRKHLRHAAVYLHQFPYMLDTSVRKNLEYVLFHRGIKGSEKTTLIDSAVELASIGNILQSHAKSLSGGEQQRVALVRAWLRQPELMLLDEPTANMDQESRLRTTRLLGELKSLGMALLVASHDPAQFAADCDYHWLLEGGTLKPASAGKLKIASPHVA